MARKAPGRPAGVVHTPGAARAASRPAISPRRHSTSLVAGTATRLTLRLKVTDSVRQLRDDYIGSSDVDVSVSVSETCVWQSLTLPLSRGLSAAGRITVDVMAFPSLDSAHLSTLHQLSDAERAELTDSASLFAADLQREVDSVEDQLVETQRLLRLYRRVKVFREAKHWGLEPAARARMAARLEQIHREETQRTASALKELQRQAAEEVCG